MVSSEAVRAEHNGLVKNNFVAIVTCTTAVDDQIIGVRSDRQQWCMPGSGMVTDALVAWHVERAHGGFIKVAGGGDHRIKRRAVERHKGLTAQRMAFHQTDLKRLKRLAAEDRENAFGTLAQQLHRTERVEALGPAVVDRKA